MTLRSGFLHLLSRKKFGRFIAQVLLLEELLLIK